MSLRRYNAFCVLALQNAILFFNHYRGVYIFPADFPQTYFGLVAFWTASIRAGVFPQWMPFNNLGFPFSLALQSGLFYPPLWVFTLSSSFPYSIQAAVVFQCLHILFGAVGFFFLGRLLTRDSGLALLGAVAFQFFGGFYSNAEHPDIVRAFAWLPWLFYAVQVVPQQTRLALRNWLVPPIVYCFVSGSYQGNLISQFAFLMGTQLLFLFSERKSWRLRSSVILFCLLGVGLATVCLLPPFLVKDFLVRSEGPAGFPTIEWSIAQWPTLFLSWQNDFYGIDNSMLSAFVTVPILCLVGLFNFRCLKENKVWVLAFILSFFLAAGKKSIVYRFLNFLLPFFSYSRFPSSDYRGLIGFFTILLGILALQGFLQQGKPKRLLLRLLVLPGLVACGFLTHTFTVSYPPKEWVVSGLLAGLTIFCLISLRSNKSNMVGGLSLLVLISGFYTVVKRSPQTWQQKLDFNQVYRQAFGADSRQVLPVSARLLAPPPSRPTLIEGSGYYWRGYLTGEYVWNTGHYETKQKQKVFETPELLSYFRKAWSPTLFPGWGEPSCVGPFGVMAKDSAMQVESLSYGLNSIHYRIHAAQDFTMVENETYFQGWSGKSSLGGRPILADSICGALRTWRLPRGDYEFVANFVVPRFFTALLISGVSLALYFCLLVLC
jgi:hypothetical protein